MLIKCKKNATKNILQGKQNLHYRKQHMFLTWVVTILYFATAEALAEQVSQENYDKGLIYPPFTNIRKISAHIAAKVAAKTYELGEIFHYEICSV